MPRVPSRSGGQHWEGIPFTRYCRVVYEKAYTSTHYCLVVYERAYLLTRYCLVVYVDQIWLQALEGLNPVQQLQQAVQRRMTQHAWYSHVGQQVCWGYVCVYMFVFLCVSLRVCLCLCVCACEFVCICVRLYVVCVCLIQKSSCNRLFSSRWCRMPDTGVGVCVCVCFWWFSIS